MKVTVKTTKSAKKEFYSKTEVVKAIQWMFECGKHEEERIFKRYNACNHNAVVYCYRKYALPRFRTEFIPRNYARFFEEGSSI